jgi:hypothetical protein
MSYSVIPSGLQPEYDQLKPKLTLGIILAGAIPNIVPVVGLVFFDWSIGSVFSSYVVAIIIAVLFDCFKIVALEKIQPVTFMHSSRSAPREERITISTKAGLLFALLRNYAYPFSLLTLYALACGRVAGESGIPDWKGLAIGGIVVFANQLATYALERQEWAPKGGLSAERIIWQTSRWVEGYIIGLFLAFFVILKLESPFIGILIFIVIKTAIDFAGLRRGYVERKSVVFNPERARLLVVATIVSLIVLSVIMYSWNALRL